MCEVYANIKEGDSGGRVTVCSGETRYRHLYSTVSNYVEIQIVNTGDSGDGSPYFAIAFQGISSSTLSKILAMNDNTEMVTFVSLYIRCIGMT